jgi:hypothetical protein
MNGKGLSEDMAAAISAANSAVKTVTALQKSQERI